MRDPSDDFRDFKAGPISITPEQAGLLAYGTSRRVQAFGGKRWRCSPGSPPSTTCASSAATSAGVSQEDVLDGIVRALQLDESERAHLFDLARAAAAGGRSRSSRRTSQERVTQRARILDALSSPAFVANARGDLLASNVLGEALYAPPYAAWSGR